MRARSPRHSVPYSHGRVHYYETFLWVWSQITPVMGNEDTGAGPNRGRSGTIKSLETSFTIVEYLQRESGGGGSEIAADTGLSKGTVHKHLATLRKHDFVTKEDGTYRLGLRFLDVGGHVRDQFVGSKVVKQKTKELAEETGEVAMFGRLEHGYIVTAFRESGPNGVPTNSRVGTRLPVHQVAAGKAILAQLPPERVDDIIAAYGLPRATEETITDPADLHRELAAIRERGHAYSYGESTPGVWTVAVPVISPGGDVLGACTVAAPKHRLTTEEFETELPSVVRSAVNEIEINIAYA